MSDDNIISAADMVARIFTNIEASKIENGNQIVSSWRSIVESIYRNGPKLAAHSKVIDFKNGILLIETDHPGWIQMLQMYKSYILKGLKKALPDVTVTSLAFRLQGTSASLTDTEKIQSYEDQRKVLEKQFSREDQVLKAFDEKKSPEEQNSRELPDNLKNLFERFKEDMLTKNK